MKCPNCDKELLMTERSGIEIDYCPSCRGVWLDRGELDKFIERANQEALRSEPPIANYPLAHPSESYPPPQRYEDRDRYRQDERYDPRYGYGKKRKSFLGELFDFD